MLKKLASQTNSEISNRRKSSSFKVLQIQDYELLLLYSLTQYTLYINHHKYDHSQEPTVIIKKSQKPKYKFGIILSKNCDSEMSFPFRLFLQINNVYNGSSNFMRKRRNLLKINIYYKKMHKRSSQRAQQDESQKNVVECHDIQYSNRNFDRSVYSNQLVTVKKTQNKDLQRCDIHLKQTNRANPEWTNDEEMKLFELQEKKGNKWKLISQELPGQRDHIAVKNYFYATLRKAIRIINNFICQHRQQQIYRTCKTFPENCIGKIIAQDQNKKRDKMRVTKANIALSAKQIKRRLLQISRMPTDRDLIEKAIAEISQFNKNCRRLRCKKRRSACTFNTHPTQNTSKRGRYFKNKKLNSQRLRMQQDEILHPQQKQQTYLQPIEQNKTNLYQMVNLEEDQLHLPQNFNSLKKEKVSYNKDEQIKDRDDYEEIVNKKDNTQIKNSSYLHKSTSQKNNGVIEVQDILLISPFYQQPANLVTRTGRNFDEQDVQQQIYPESVDFS